jgi:hypothetical protein
MSFIARAGPGLNSLYPRLFRTCARSKGSKSARKPLGRFFENNDLTGNLFHHLLSARGHALRQVRDPVPHNFQAQVKACLTELIPLGFSLKKRGTEVMDAEFRKFKSLDNIRKIIKFCSDFLDQKYHFQLSTGNTCLATVASDEAPNIYNVQISNLGSLTFNGNELDALKRDK